MTSTANFQHSLHLQMLGSKKEEEEDFEAKNQPEYAHQQQENGTNIAKLSSIPSTSNGRYGRIVKVEGGHVVRSIPRKDRHSKVCTSKGPRDRRFRLSAQTAIDFYDLQDRLGYDRPSKAIDWLMHKSKAAIEALGHSSTAHQFQHPQQCNFMPAGTVQNRQQHLNEITVNNVSKEPVFGCVGEEALKSAFNLSEANFMEMGWFQNLMAWNHSAGDGGEGCSFKTS